MPEEQNAKFYITTAIPYVNAEPHIGTALDALLADALARYYRQHKTKVHFSVGTDEHGSKIIEKAETQKVTPKVFADKMSGLFKELHTELNVSYDVFVRTSDPEHEATAQYVWEQLSDNIYSGEYEGLYCVGCEAFVTEAVAKQNKGECPEHKRPYEKLKEKNYFFKLSKFAPKIKSAIESGELQILPESRKHEILAVIKEGLEDISISRPKEKISWGVPVPGDDSQTMYVWFEALINYLSAVKYPKGADFKHFWAPDVQIIGKDILRFHAAIWPGMLLGIGLPLPKQIMVHGFITSGGSKMSKSIGNGVTPKEILQAYGTDALRYYFLRHIPTFEDGDFTWEKFEAVYNGELGDDLGNLVQRTASMIKQYQNGVIGDMPGPQHDTEPYHEAMQARQIDKAIEYTWVLIRGLNQYVEEEKPWTIAKEKDAEHLQEVLAYLSGSLIQIAQMLWPFMPQTAEMIRDIFSKGVIQNYEGVLFPRIENVKKPAKQPAENADA